MVAPTLGSDVPTYDRRALRQIERLKNPEPSRLTSVLDAINGTMARAAGAVLNNKVGELVSDGIERVLETINQGASWAVRDDIVFRAFRDGGHAVHERRDIQRLSLRDVDKTVRRRTTKSKSHAFAIGASTGMLGAPGIALDIPGIFGVALRAINEYAAYYGFDVSTEDEKAFVLLILATVSTPTFAERQKAMAELTKVSLLLAGRDPRGESRRVLSTQLVARLANTIAVRLVQSKPAQGIPIVGAAVGAAFDVWFLHEVTRMAFQLYRERFLIHKHGPQVAVSVRGYDRRYETGATPSAAAHR
jgi:hypothetical protein